MPSIFDTLLDPNDTLDDPTRRAATAAALRRQYDYGTIGQLMGIEPTMRVGQSAQEQAFGSLRTAMDKQRAQKEAAARESERKQAQANWEAQMERDRARDAEQRRQFQIQEARLAGSAKDSEWSSPVADQINGGWVVVSKVDPNKFIRIASDGTTSGTVESMGAGDASGLPPSGVVRPGGKPPTEGESKSGLLAATQVNTLNTIANADPSMRKPGFMESVITASGINPDAQTFLVGGVAGPERNTVRGAQDAFIDAGLTAITGAAYTPHQIAAFRNRFMPNYWDTEDTLKIKTDAAVEFARQAAINANRAWTPERDMQFRQMMGQLYNGGIPQQPQAPASSGRNFEAEYGLGGN